MRLTRRTFVAAGAGVLAAAATPQIVDTHIHLYDPTRPQGVPWPPKNDSLLYKPTLPQAYEAMVRPLGVTRAIVVEASAWLEDNQWILDLAKSNPIIGGLVGHLTPGTSEFREHLARFGKNPLFRGIRLNGTAITAGAGSAVFMVDLQRLAGAGLMLDAIGNSSMIPALLKVTDQIPSLRVAIDHMPGEPPGWQEMRPAMKELAARKLVYSKVSGAVESGSGLLDELWEMFGADRVMYGSNWPVSERLAPYAAVLGKMQKYLAGKDASVAAKYFYSNSRACYGW